MNYFDAVVLNDNKTYTGTYGSYVILNAIEDEYAGEVIETEDSIVIPIQDLINTYLKLHLVMPTSQHSSSE